MSLVTISNNFTAIRRHPFLFVGLRYPVDFLDRPSEKNLHDNKTQQIKIPDIE